MSEMKERAKAFCQNGKSAFVFDRIVLKFMANFAKTEVDTALAAERARIAEAVEKVKRPNYLTDAYEMWYIQGYQEALRDVLEVVNDDTK